MIEVIQHANKIAKALLIKQQPKNSQKLRNSTTPFNMEEPTEVGNKHYWCFTFSDGAYAKKKICQQIFFFFFSFFFFKKNLFSFPSIFLSFLFFFLGILFIICTWLYFIPVFLQYTLYIQLFYMAAQSRIVM